MWTLFSRKTGNINLDKKTKMFLWKLTNVSWSTSELRARLRLKTGLSPPVKYFTDRSKAVLLLWIIYVFSVLRWLCLCVRLFICALWSPARKGLTSCLSFVVSDCEFVTFPLVSWVRCGTWLYQFLIFASLLTLLKRTRNQTQVNKCVYNSFMRYGKT